MYLSVKVQEVRVLSETPLSQCVLCAHRPQHANSEFSSITRLLRLEHFKTDWMFKLAWHKNTCKWIHFCVDTAVARMSFKPAPGHQAVLIVKPWLLNIYKSVDIGVWGLFDFLSCNYEFFSYISHEFISHDSNFLSRCFLRFFSMKVRIVRYNLEYNRNYEKVSN